MALSFSPSNLGAWELVFQKQLVPLNSEDNLPFNVARPKVSRTPYLELVEIPLIPVSRIFLIGTFSIDVKPTWYRAGYLIQEILGVKINDTVIFQGLNSTPETTVDATNQVIGLNRIQLVVLNKYSNNFALRFEPVAWLKSLNLAMWEYRGEEKDSTEDLIQAMRAKLETIEFKIDNKL